MQYSTHDSTPWRNGQARIFLSYIFRKPPPFRDKRLSSGTESNSTVDNSTEKTKGATLRKEHYQAFRRPPHYRDKHGLIFKENHSIVPSLFLCPPGPKWSPSGHKRSHFSTMDERVPEGFCNHLLKRSCS